MVYYNTCKEQENKYKRRKNMTKIEENLSEKIETAAFAQSEEMYDYGVESGYKVFVFDLTENEETIKKVMKTRYDSWTYTLKKNENQLWDLIIDF